jgi:hypothetical protein
MKERQLKRTTTSLALIAVAIPLVSASAQPLSPMQGFEGSTTLSKNGATQSVHISVQSWRIVDQAREIPVRGFFVAHLLSGQISTIIDGKTTEHLPGDYWTVKPDEIMRVKVIGEVAVLETTLVTKE